MQNKLSMHLNWSTDVSAHSFAPLLFNIVNNGGVLCVMESETWLTVKGLGCKH